MFSPRNQGYALLEVLVALAMISYLILYGIQWQHFSLQTSTREFYHLLATNEARNFIERLRADFSNREQEHKLWQLELQLLLPNSVGSYWCSASRYCEVKLQWHGQKEIIFPAIV